MFQGFYSPNTVQWCFLDSAVNFDHALSTSCRSYISCAWGDLYYGFFFLICWSQWRQAEALFLINCIAILRSLSSIPQCCQHQPCFLVCWLLSLLRAENKSVSEPILQHLGCHILSSWLLVIRLICSCLKCGHFVSCPSSLFQILGCLPLSFLDPTMTELSTLHCNYKPPSAYISSIPLWWSVNTSFGTQTCFR